ncbi:hypothetical protein ACI797_14480 [Geodermatophilus sp. SYSU D00691]
MTRAAADLGRAAPWARAAGMTGMAANGLLVAVVLAASPDRWTRRLGLAATGVLTLAGPALVTGLVPFRVQMPVALGGFGALAAWIGLSSRRAPLPDDVARLGVLSGGAPAALGGLAVPTWFLRHGRVTGRLPG